MKKKLLIFISNYSLFQVGFEMINLYGAVYFYQRFDNSIVIALGSIILLQLSYITTLLLIAGILGKLGTKISMIIGSILFFISFFPLTQLENDKDIKWVAIWILISMFAKAFHHMPFFYYISKFTDSKKRGSELGVVDAISVFFEALAPLIGGLTLQLYGIASLAYVSFVIFGLSIIPLLFLENYHFSYNTSVFQVIKMRFAKHLVRLHIVNELQANNNKAWSIYVFILLGGNFESMGIIFSVVIVISAIISYFVGKALDHLNRRKLLHLEGIISSLSWFLRSITNTYPMILVADTIFMINRYLKDEVVDVLNLDLLNHENHDEVLDEVILVRQVTVNVSMAVSLLISLILVTVFGFKAAFIFSGVASFLFFII